MNCETSSLAEHVVEDGNEKNEKYSQTRILVPGEEKGTSLSQMNCMPIDFKPRQRVGTLCVFKLLLIRLFLKFS